MSHGVGGNVTRVWTEEDENMISMRTSVVITMMVAAILGSMITPSGVAQAIKTDDPTTFGDNPAIMDQDKKLAERFFHVEWTAREERSGTRITGYVYNDYGQAAEGIQLLITGLDSAGQPVSTAIERLGDTVPARGRGFFDVQVPESPSYRVDVESFEFEEGTGAK
jgi:hypothetical protein